MLEAYSHEADDRARRMARVAPKAVPYSWKPEALNDDGSLKSGTEAPAET